MDGTEEKAWHNVMSNIWFFIVAAQGRRKNTPEIIFSKVIHSSLPALA